MIPIAHLFVRRVESTTWVCLSENREYPKICHWNRENDSFFQTFYNLFWVITYCIDENPPTFCSQLLFNFPPFPPPRHAQTLETRCPRRRRAQRHTLAAGRGNAGATVTKPSGAVDAAAVEGRVGRRWEDEDLIYGYGSIPINAIFSGIKNVSTGMVCLKIVYP